MSQLLRRLLQPARPHRGPTSARARLWLRALEDRLVPATFTVTNIGDTGTGSGTSGDLRYCITQADAAAGPNTIFATGITGTIALRSPLPPITRDLTITGPGASVLTINGFNGWHIFAQATSNFTVNSLTLSGGRTTTDGGAIVTGQNLTVRNCVISGCSADRGSAIFCSSGASVTVAGSVIQNNSTAGGGGAIYSGYGGGSITISGSLIQNNSAGGGGGAIGIFGSPQTTLTVTNSQLLNNSAFDGGAVWIDDPAIVNIDHSTIAGNRVARDGAGLNFISGNTGAVTITNSTVVANTAARNGGGARIGGTVPLRITSSTITGDTATTGFGGGIYDGTITLDSSIVSGNSVKEAARGSDISATTPVAAKYSAIGSTTGFTLTNNGGNITGTNASPAALKLGPLGTFSGPNGAFPMFPVKYGSAAVDAGDPALAGTTDERGLKRPQDTNTTTNPNRQPDMGAFERSPGPDALLTAAGVTAAGGTTYTFAVTYGDFAPINTTTLGSGNVAVTTPAGISPVNVTLAGYDAGNPNSVVATYQFTVPGGGWAAADNGNYTVVMQPNQVSDANGFVSGGPVGAFLVAIPNTFTVTSIGDTGAGTGLTGDLRYCINMANATAGPNTIDATGVMGTISLTAALPAVTRDLTVIGPGASLLTVNANGFGSVLALGPFITFGVSGLTLSGGKALVGGGGINAEAFGDAVTVANCVISGNSSNSEGGGISVLFGTLSVENSTISSNTCAETDNGPGDGRGNGGGINYYGFPSELAISNSTIADNSCYAGAGLNLTFNPDDAAARIVNCTITGNVPIYTAAAGAAGIYANVGLISMDNSIVSGNVNPLFPGGSEIEADVAAQYCAFATMPAVLTDLGHNLIGASATPAALGLGPLTEFPVQGSNPPQTMPVIPLRVGSTAMEAGDPSQNGTYDERGVFRPQPPGERPLYPDIGAFERTPGPDAVATAANVTSGGTSYTFTVTYSDTVSIDVATLGSGNVTVSGALTLGGSVAPAVTFGGADASNPYSVIATYQFTPPGGLWTRDDNGNYSITMQPNQVSDANGFATPVEIGCFVVAIPQTLTVTNSGDAGTGSGAAGDLRYCINRANFDGTAADTIVFSNSTAGGTTNFYDGAARTISLTSPLPSLTDAVTIVGPGAAALTINANGTGGVITTDPARGSTVTLSGLTLSGGKSRNNGGGIDDAGGNLVLSNCEITNNSAANGYGGGGIEMASTGTVKISNSTITGNSADGGGGIDVESYSPGLLTVTDATISNNNGGYEGGGISVYLGELILRQSTVAGNTASRGGGLSVLYSAVLIEQSTVSGNVAASTSSGGGGLYLAGSPISVATARDPLTGLSISNSTIANNTGNNGGGIDINYFYPASVTELQIVNSTITGNSALSTAATSGAGGGGISLNPSATSYTGAVALDGTVVSGNRAANGSADIATDTAGPVSTTYSAIGSTTGFTYTPGHGDVPVGASLNLQPLANNGGPTQTIAFSAGSPLLNAGDPSLATTTDQRGVPRTIGPAPDIGAYEYQPITIANVQVNDGSAQRSEVRSITVTFSGPVSFAGGNAAPAFQLQHVQDSTNVNNLAAAVSTNGSGDTVVTLTFTTTGNASTEIDPVSAENGGMASLADGRYQLNVFGSAVSDAALGWALDGDVDGTPGGDYLSPTDTLGGGPGELGLYRLFGDADGNGIVDQVDLGQFRSTFNAGAGNPRYLSYLDADNSGVVDQLDLGQFQSRFNSNVFAPQTPSAAPIPPTVASVGVNDGSAEPSEVRSIPITFSGPVVFGGGNADAAAAFQLDDLTDSNGAALAAAVSSNVHSRTVVTLTFSGAETEPLSSESGGMASLAHGRFTLTVLSANVRGANGMVLNGGVANGNYVSPADTLGGGPGQLHLYRLFGDGIVDQTDLGQFRTPFDAGIGNPLYLPYLDADNSGSVDQVDLGQFRSRFNANVF